MNIQFTKPKMAIGTEFTADDWNGRTQAISDTVFCRVSNNWQFTVGEWIVVSTFTWDGGSPSTIALSDTDVLKHSEGTLDPYVDMRLQSDGEVELLNELRWQPLCVANGIHYAVGFHPCGDQTGIGTDSEVPRTYTIKWDATNKLQIQPKAEAFLPPVPYDYDRSDGTIDYLPGRMYWVDPDYSVAGKERVLVIEGVWGTVPYILVRELIFTIDTETWSQEKTGTIYDFSGSTDFDDPSKNEPTPVSMMRMPNGDYILHMWQWHQVEGKNPRFIVHFDDTFANGTRIEYEAGGWWVDPGGWDLYRYTSSMPDARFIEILYGSDRWGVNIYGTDGSLLVHQEYSLTEDTYEVSDGIFVRSWVNDKFYVIAADYNADRLIVFKFDFTTGTLTRTHEGFVENPDEYPDGSTEYFWYWAGSWTDLGRHIGYTRQVNTSGPDSVQNKDLAAVFYVPNIYTPRSISARKGGPRVHYVRPGRHQS